MVTKRQLGVFVIVLACVSMVGLIGADIIGAGRWSGFGPLQRLGAALAGVAIVTGLLLISRGQRPA